MQICIWFVCFDWHQSVHYNATLNWLFFYSPTIHIYNTYLVHYSHKAQSAYIEHWTIHNTDTKGLLVSLQINIEIAILSKIDYKRCKNLLSMEIGEFSEPFLMY